MLEQKEEGAEPRRANRQEDVLQEDVTQMPSAVGFLKPIKIPLPEATPPQFGGRCGLMPEAQQATLVCGVRFGVLQRVS